MAIPGVRIVSSTDANGQPSVLQRLGAKTADAFDSTKEKAAAVSDKGKEKAKEVEEKVRKV